MAERSGSDGSGALGSLLAGAVIGAAGLAWWLLAEAERRRTLEQQQRRLRLSRLQSGGDPLDGTDASGPQQERQLHQKVHELNQQIEAVRRQLEQLQPQG
ncbi:MAG: hypothetical protein FJ054_00200 [Cyanobacteria bacterium M_surface_10_m2_119]|nr:hypothetical protein [Cyanobacteria bacterium M_surface_10_m2_119]